MTCLEIVCGIIVALIAFYYYLTVNNNFWKNRGVPGPEPMVGFGNVQKLTLGKESLPDFLTRLYSEYKAERIFGIFLRRKPVLIVQDPELIKDVLIKDFSKFTNRGFLVSNPAVPLSNHLFALEARRWRPLRTQLSPVFTSGKLKGTFSLILECSNHLEKYLDHLVEEGEPIDVRDVSAKFSTDVIGSCAFGIEMNSLSDQESIFRRAGKKIFATNFLNVLRIKLQLITPTLYAWISRILPTPEEIELIIRITKETLEYREKNSIVRPDFMNTLLDLKRHPEKVADIELSDELLASQAFIFFAAGFETSSTTISNALYELALNHDIQDKLREEIKEFEERNGGEWRYETIKEMLYLDKVFRETLRKYPALPFLSRELVDSYTFQDSKATLPKGTVVWIPVFPIHRDPSIYPDPEKFDPERFSEDSVKQRHPMHYLPFGHGPRNCIGARFGIYQTKIGLIKILRKNKIDVCSKTMIPYKFNAFAFILTPVMGVYLKITRID
ncbi:PREDICTED: probable cytochrome P450 6a14 [Eufriesea mexicana]|uniref:probable cytochrome P450 6a14 n=1 Tax=Eufriesea mexicana TaxID=516756 RepID=UPI00083C8B61|nr:PREDICTED: probable cytochrome P450 6a14 [Eufriesea mexicana]